MSVNVKRLLCILVLAAVVFGWFVTGFGIGSVDSVKDALKYGLDINLPTGESRTHANAVVPDGVARFSRLGEGWNVTPRLEVTKHLDKYTDVTWRTGYSFRGSYADSWDD